jgi:hypothetical protein
MQLLSRRLPARRDVGYAYGGVIFLIYTWALRGFFYQLSSLILYHPAGEIFAIFCYMMALALLESLTVLAGLLLLAVILPRAWFARGFAYKGFLTALVSGAGAVALERFLTRGLTQISYLYIGLALCLLVLLVVFLVIERFPRIQRILADLVDRLNLFTYIYLPLGILSLVVVLIRNL